MMTVDEALSFADRMYTKSSFAGVLAAEVRRLCEENERLRKDAERGCYFIERGEWFRHDHGTPDAHALLAIRLPYTADLSCKAMREFAIDAARGAK
jgi:hypothetical protein